jgi:hypothetical protein
LGGSEAEQILLAAAELQMLLLGLTASPWESESYLLHTLQSLLL